MQSTAPAYRVTESPLAMEPVTRDPFADGLDAASHLIRPPFDLAAYAAASRRAESAA